MQCLKKFSLEDSNSFQLIIFISLIIHVITAFMSLGYHQWDEHYQILEFLALKLNQTSPGDLTWEFTHGMRSWLQPFLYYLVIKPIQLVGIENKFFYAFILRTITSIFSWYSLAAFSLATTKFFQEEKFKRLNVLFLHLIWFIPYIHARTSSENLAGALFMLALAFIIKNMDSEWKCKESSIADSLIIGLLFGLSYLTRFQMGLMVATAWFWLFFIGYSDRRNLALQALAIIATFALGYALDYWGYGKITHTAWNYFNENLIQGKQANYGEQPWYDMFRLAFNRGIPPFSLILIISTILFWLKKPLNLFTVTMIPLVLIHSYASSKQLRFIFPILPFTPFLMLILIQEAKEKADFLFNPRFKRLFSILVVANFILMIASSIKPANTAVAALLAIYKRKDQISQVAFHGSDPVYPIGEPITFYRDNRTIFRPVDTIENLSRAPIAWKLVDRVNKAQFILANSNCQIEFSTYPEVILKLQKMEKRRAWTLFHCP